MKTLRISSLFVVSAIACLSSCGKPDSPAVSENPVPVTTGNALVGNQCPYGSSTLPKPVKLALWHKNNDLRCPVDMKQIEFTQEFQPIYLGAICKKKTMSARTQDRNGPDSFWETLPNGDFSLTVDGIVGKLKTDGKGHDNCVLPVSANIEGNLKCLDPNQADDKANFHFEIYYHPLAKIPAGAPANGAHPDGPVCQLPADCYFWAGADVKQCQ